MNPADLKITDLRFADIDGAPKRCTLVKLYTSQEGLVGYGEVRDASSRTYAAMLKSRILGKKPLNVEKGYQLDADYAAQPRELLARDAKAKSVSCVNTWTDSGWNRSIVNCRSGSPWNFHPTRRC